MNDDIEVVDKWAVIVGNKHASGDLSLHLHRIYDYELKNQAIDDLKYLRDMYEIAFVQQIFVQQIKCDKKLY